MSGLEKLPPEPGDVWRDGKQETSASLGLMSRKMLSVIAVALLVLALGWVWLFKPFWTVSQGGQAMREKALYAVIVVYYASDVAWHWLHDPFKVTDPDDPRFDPYRFKFKDYKSDSQRFLAFKKMFSPGNSREYVEKILVDSAEGKRHEIASGYVGYYWVPWWWTGDSYGVTVVYDANDRLIAMRTHNAIIFGSEELKLVGERLVVQARERAIIKERQRKGIKP